MKCFHELARRTMSEQERHGCIMEVFGYSGLAEGVATYTSTYLE